MNTNCLNRSMDGYTVVRELGRGGTSVVYLVQHNRLKVYRAVKQVYKSKVSIESYFTETNILKRMDIRGIPRIYDIEEDEEFWYIIEEYIDGISYNNYISDCTRTREELIDSLYQICDIISELHKVRIVYNDLKQENIIVRCNKVHIVDFGNCSWRYVASMASADNVTPEHMHYGTLDVYTDIYGIGALIQEVFQLQKRLFSDDRRVFMNVISGCMEKEKRDRFESAYAVKCYMEKHLGEGEMKRIYGKKEALEEDGLNDIYVYGCRRHSGVTHFALGLTKYLARIKREALYVETRYCNGASAFFFGKLQELNCKNGIYIYDECRIMPYYGEFLVLPEKDKDSQIINIYDCGIYKDERLPKRGIVIVVITDKKSFGSLEYAECEKGNSVLYVVNFSDRTGYRRYERAAEGVSVYMPYFENPFILDREVMGFYRRVCMMIWSKAVV